MIKKEILNSNGDFGINWNEQIKYKFVKVKREIIDGFEEDLANKLFDFFKKYICKNGVIIDSHIVESEDKKCNYVGLLFHYKTNKYWDEESDVEKIEVSGNTQKIIIPIERSFIGETMVGKSLPNIIGYIQSVVRKNIDLVNNAEIVSFRNVTIANNNKLLSYLDDTDFYEVVFSTIHTEEDNLFLKSWPMYSGGLWVNWDRYYLTKDGLANNIIDEYHSIYNDLRINTPLWKTIEDYKKGWETRHGILTYDFLNRLKKQVKLAKIISGIKDSDELGIECLIFDFNYFEVKVTDGSVFISPLQRSEKEKRIKWINNNRETRFHQYEEKRDSLNLEMVVRMDEGEVKRYDLFDSENEKVINLLDDFAETSHEKITEGLTKFLINYKNIGHLENKINNFVARESNDYLGIATTISLRDIVFSNGSVLSKKITLTPLDFDKQGIKSLDKLSRIKLTSEDKVRNIIKKIKQEDDNKFQQVKRLFKFKRGD